MLVPAIVQFLSEKGYSEVRVEPYEKQKKILAKHYGFVEGHFGEMKLEW
jgi:hypothetical protein